MRSPWWDLMMGDGPVFRSTAHDRCSADERHGQAIRRIVAGKDPERERNCNRNLSARACGPRFDRATAVGAVPVFGFQVSGSARDERKPRNSEPGTRNPELNSWPRWEVFDRVTVNLCKANRVGSMLSHPRWY